MSKPIRFLKILHQRHHSPPIVSSMADDALHPLKSAAARRSPSMKIKRLRLTWTVFLVSPTYSPANPPFPWSLLNPLNPSSAHLCPTDAPGSAMFLFLLTRSIQTFFSFSVRSPRGRHQRSKKFSGTRFRTTACTLYC